MQSHALVEHCRSIPIRRLQPERLARLDPEEMAAIIHRLTRMVGS